MAPAAARKLLDPNVPNDPAVMAAFRAVPETMVAEIFDGELHTMPRPARRHTNTASLLGGELHGPFRRGTGGPGGWVILDEPEIHLGPRPDVVVPDLAGWRRERMPDAVGADDAPPHDEVAPSSCPWRCSGNDRHLSARRLRAPARVSSDRRARRRASGP